MILSCTCSEPPAPNRLRSTLFATDGGMAYVNECIAAGVPVPSTVLGPGWVRHFDVATGGAGIDPPFIAPRYEGYPLEAELWSWSSSNPRGICLALPRWQLDAPNDPNPNVNTAAAFGVICQGQASSTACFFDNPRRRYFARDAGHPIENFVGGIDLTGNDQGVCTDCHAGANAFVIHPEKPAFRHLRSNQQRLQLLGTLSGWYNPLVVETWPQNRGPFTALARYPNPSGASCTTCHELPRVSRETPGYCYSILQEALGRTTETMPPVNGLDASVYAPGGEYFDHRALFQNHIRTLQSFCDAGIPAGETVEIEHTDDVAVLSPPWLDSPYVCGRAVLVRGVVPGAEVRLFRNTLLVESKTSEFGGDVAFNLGRALVPSDELRADQSIHGTTSDESPPTWPIDYPGALPKPEVYPSTVYRCANIIGARTVRGSRLTAHLIRNNQTIASVTQDAPGEWTEISFPGQVFELGDTFSVRTRLCSNSPYSDPVSTIEPSSLLNPPKLDPLTSYEGQTHAVVNELDYGAFASISVSPGTSSIGDTYPVADGNGAVLYLPTSGHGGPLQLGEVLTAEASLFCPSGGPVRSSVTGAPARSCKELPAPEISTPVQGENSVGVEKSLTGARIRLLRNGLEIADGVAPVVRLKFPLTFATGDRITAIQQLGTCQGTRGFEILAVAGGEP